MVADGLLTRKRYREVPPRVDYELTARAGELMPILGELARWGYEWAWGPPRQSESVDLGAIFRLAPGLARLQTGAHGTVEMTVSATTTGRPAASYSFTVSGAGVSIQERRAEQAEARVAGSEAAWIEAFSPARDRTALSFSGDRQFAESLLDEISVGSALAHGAVRAVA